MVEDVLQCVKISDKDPVNVELPEPHDAPVVVLPVELPEVVHRIPPGLPGHQLVRVANEGQAEARGAQFEVSPVVDDVAGDVEDKEGATEQQDHPGWHQMGHTVSLVQC